MPLVRDGESAVVTRVVCILNASRAGDDERVLTIVDGLRERVGQQELISVAPSLICGNGHPVIDRTTRALERIDSAKTAIRPRRRIERLDNACADLIPVRIKNG